jgi:NAD(P)-dependent dehydrogenase (short-subunit alcohol dehydrogenase family)
MQDLNDKVAVVTGAASGIGRGMIDAFASEGMKLVLADIEPVPLSAAVKELSEHGATVIGIECDVSDPAALEALRDRTLEEYGAVHVLCNNAGVGGGGGFASWEAPEEEWRWIFGVNFLGVLYGHRSFIPAMIEQGEGHIVNTASMAGVVPSAGIYGVTKHAVVALSETTFGELTARGDDIGISVLCPGWIRTRILESERNRPEAPRAEPPPAPPGMELMRAMVEGLVEKGQDPLTVGHLVVDSIKRRRFYVLTHPHWKNMVRHRAENIIEGRDPTSVAPEGDGSDWFPTPD